MTQKHMKHPSSWQPEELRRLAQERSKHVQPRLAQIWSQLSEEALMEELWMHHHELELQIESFQQTLVEKEESLARYRTLYEGVPAGYCTLDELGIILEINGLGAALFGMGRSALLNRQLAVFMTEEGKGAFTEFLSRAQRSGAMERCEVICLRDNSEPVTLFIEGMAVPHGAERPSCIRAVMIDVTQRRLLEATVSQITKLDMVGQLAGGIAHEFNNLLTIILGYCNLIRAEAKPDMPFVGDVAEIQDAAERAALLTKKLLSYSRREMRQPKHLDLREFLQSSQDHIRSLLGDHITLEMATGSQPCYVKVDPEQLNQMILDLVRNASDAMQQGGALSLALTTVPASVGASVSSSQTVGVRPSGPCAVLTIRDNGCGMDETTRARAFEPFFTTKPVGSGAGLGLSAVYGIVQQNEGSLQLTSELGRGTTVAISLPLIDQAAKPSIVPTRLGTILLVEDDRTVRKLLCSVLQRKGYKVLVAEGASDALRLLDSDEAASVGLLLTDVVMPDISGRALADMVMERCPEMKVLFMSGYTDDVIVKQNVLVGRTGFLQKPFTAEVLLRVVEEVIRPAV
jgi:PAS domain S-box-containing protein